MEKNVTLPQQDLDNVETKQSWQRASVKWILSKAFNNRVPDNLKEPFYRDHEGHDHLKPQIVVGLGNASLYCQTLSNLYSDPNYQSLNHWSILQTLSRKGVPVAETPEMPLTETVLIQTNPLRINAHMSVIEALMILYAKEVASNDRISSAINRISGGSLPRENQHHEAALLCWISHACAALKKRVDQEVQSGAVDENGSRFQSPDIAPVRDYRDLCDGVCLAYLVAYYCPKVIPWTSVRFNYMPTVEDSISNVLLVSNFSQKHLPYSVFHMTPQDITYMRGSMKQNLVVLLADLFNLFEIHPAKCVCYPGMETQSIEAEREGATNEHGIQHRRGLTCPPVAPIPDLRSGLDSPTTSPPNKLPFQVNRSASATVTTSMRKATPPREEPPTVDEGFVVHRGRAIPTLASMQEPVVPVRARTREKSSTDFREGVDVAAGRPSNWEDARRPSFAGRRSRRNSTSDDSQLTIENFGGSQDQLHMIGRTLERERKVSNVIIEPAVAVRSSLADARGSIQFGYDTDGCSGSEKQDRDTEKPPTPMRRQSQSGESTSASLRNITHSKDRDLIDGDMSNQFKSVTVDDDQAVSQPVRKTSFATLPNTTTWQQQSINFQSPDNHSEYNDERSNVDASKLSTVRMKLEERRRHIAHEKRKMELALNRQQQKVGKAAFLQAINKGKAQIQTETDSKDVVMESADDNKPERPCSLKDLTDINTLESKWDSVESKRTPDLDQMDIEQYQQSIALKNSSLQDIQQDIYRLQNLESQMQAQHVQAQQLMHAQQIANMIYGSQQHIPGQYGRSSVPQTNFGSSPHLAQQHQFQSATMMNNIRQTNRDSNIAPIQYINEQGQYVSNLTHSQNAPQVSHEYSPFMSENGGSQYLVQHSPYQNQYPDSNQYHTYRVDHSHQTPPHRQVNVGNSGLNAAREQASPQTGQFFLHDTPPQPPARRTWAQSATNAPPTAIHQVPHQATTQTNQQHQQLPLDINAWQQNSPKIDTRTWKSLNQPSNHNANSGFMLHQNGGNDFNSQSYTNLFQSQDSPKHNNRIHQQISQIMSVNTGPTHPPNDYRGSKHSPQIDDMAPQSISFIGDEDSVDLITEHPPPPSYNRNTAAQRPNIIHHDQDIDLAKLNITSGKLTYRIPSPTRPSLNMNSFQDPNEEINNDQTGFFVAFDTVQSKRPKPPLRTKRSPKKDSDIEGNRKQEQINQLEKELEQERQAQVDSKHHGFENSHAFNSNGNKRLEGNETITRKHVSDNQVASILDRRHLEDVTNHQQQASLNNSSGSESRTNHNKALIIDEQMNKLDPESVDEMERKKEKIMLLSLQRRQQQEEAKARKEIQAMQRREKEREKEDERSRKREEQAARRAAILEQHRLKKAIEEAEQKGITLDRNDLMALKHQQSLLANQNSGTPKMRTQRMTRPRPKTIHVETGSVELSEASSLSSRNKKGSNSNLTGIGQLSSNSIRRDYYRGSQDSLAIRESPDEYPSTNSTPIGRRGSCKMSREPSNVERGRTLSRISVAKGSNLNFKGRKSNSLMNLCDTDSGLGRATPPRRAPSPGMGPSGRHLPSPSGPGSLPPGFMNKRGRIFDDGSSDLSSTPSSMMEYSGPKLYKQPATKSNRGIILNAVEYCVFPGVVNRDAKQKVLDKINRSEAKHFLVLFRDAGCQFRALYSYWPENETILKLYGTGPTQVDEFMFDRFFKYNSGGKCFSQIHTKHLTVTIDAFTIHNSLWQGKKVNLPSKKDMALVI